MTTLQQRVLQLLGVLLLSSLCWADSLPLTTMQFSGVSCLDLAAGTSNYWCYAEKDPVAGPTATFLAIHAFGQNSLLVPGAYAHLFGQIVTTTVDGNQIAGTFAGDDFVVHGTGIYEYAVTGTYFVNASQPAGNAGLSVLSAIPMGRVGTTPEPGTLALGFTGLAGMLGAWRALRH